ncbi:hypothetical protein [Crenalkalicoccus roseus]|uniref:hypothetical protein n=1 Tax=Crenalkalicoccus roseus TaxID=1485588 RepID=UPI0010816B72|nr:hypothetical protein [Crenalkalicoccus roseus]
MVGIPAACSPVRGAPLRAARARAVCLALLLLALGGCSTGYAQLSGAAATLNREVATLQDDMVLRNILRRSAGQPAHFSSLPLIRGRNRFTTSVGLTLPFGRGGNARTLFEPAVEAEIGPGFDYATLYNDQFLGPMRAPVSMETLAAFLRTGRSREAILTTAIGGIRWRDGAGTRSYVNDPENPAGFAAFQQRLERLMDQGLTTEVALLVRNVSPPFPLDQTPVLGELGIAQREGLMTEELPREPGERTRRFQLRRLDEGRRFCFAAPRERLKVLARCGGAPGEWRPRFQHGDPRAFGGTSPVVFDAGAEGRIEIELRSPLEMLDYLGALVRLGPERGPMVRRADGARMPLFVVEPWAPGRPALAATALHGRRHVIPAGEAGGHSGEAFSFLVHLVGTAQSVLNVPMTGVVVGD